jgi:hypothetical protein
MGHAVPVAAVALALAGCGVAPSPEQALSDATGTSASAGSSRILVTADGDPYFRGSFEYDQGTGFVDAFDGQSAMIVTEQAVFEELDSDALAGLEVGKVRWLSYPTESAPLGILDPLVASPADLFELVEAAKEPTRAGSGEERGEPVTRYWAKLDIEDFIARLPVDERKELREFFVDVWPASLRDGVALDLALDSKGRIRRLDLTFVEGEKFVVELFDYGLDVHATAPPAELVMTSADYQRLLEQRMREECEKRGIKVAPGQVHCGGCGGEAATPTPGSGSSPTPGTAPTEKPKVPAA